MMMLRLFFSVFFVLLSLPALAQDPKISFVEARSEYIEDFTGRSLDIVLHISRGGFDTEQTFTVAIEIPSSTVPKDYDLKLKPSSAGSLTSSSPYTLTVPAGTRVITLVLEDLHDTNKTDDYIYLGLRSSSGNIFSPAFPDTSLNSVSHRIDIVDLRDDAPDTFDQAQRHSALEGTLTFPHRTTRTR